jgi:AcrR family transcriptional regulator
MPEVTCMGETARRPIFDCHRDIVLCDIASSRRSRTLPIPKIVDHDRRREDIADVTLRVIRNVGVENATIRAISRAGGFSSGVLAHYFSDKEELIGFAFQWTAEQAFRDLESLSSTHPPGLARVRASLEKMLPVPAPNAEHTHLAISMSYWSHALHNPKLAAMFHENYERWRNYVRRFLKEAIDAGEVRRDLSIEDEVDLLVSAVDGLWISESLDPARFTARRRNRLIDRMARALEEPRVLRRKRVYRRKPVDT